MLTFLYSATEVKPMCKYKSILLHILLYLAQQIVENLNAHSNDNKILSALAYYDSNNNNHHTLLSWY